MKTKIIVACIAATLVITFIACDLFGSKKQNDFSIEGQWIIDSIENKGNDSSNNMTALLFAMAKKDSLPLEVAFNSDSSFQFLNTTDTIKGSYYLSEDRKSIFIKEDSVYTPLNFINKTAISFSAVTSDSTVYHLRKK